jgi:Xaa-Pro dipeptidase
MVIWDGSVYNDDGGKPMNNQRMQRLQELLKITDIDAVVLNPGSTLMYLTGMNFHLMERPVVLLITSDADPVIVLPHLESIKVESSSLTLSSFTYDDNPAHWNTAFEKAVESIGIDGKIVGVEANRLRFLELQFLKNAAPEAMFVEAGSVLNDLRLHKDQEEIESMRQAVHIAQDALTATLPAIHAGVPEREIASELMLQLLHAGSDPEFPFAPIVSGGPNGANPHAAPGNRRLQSGDLLVIDWGASYGGYVSDLTRTFAIGQVDEEYRHIHEIVVQANAAGRAAARPGIPAGDVDRAARQVIEAAGYGQYFTHRTGHGLGMEGHEHPYIYGENQQILEPGMAFTVEPGIYLPGRNGVRIEDDVIITEDRGESLSDFPRELRYLE